MTIVWAFHKLPASQEPGSRCGQGSWGGGGEQPAGEPSAQGQVHSFQDLERGQGWGSAGRTRPPSAIPGHPVFQEVGLVRAEAGWAPGRHGLASALGLCGGQA